MMFDYQKYKIEVARKVMKKEEEEITRYVLDEDEPIANTQTTAPEESNTTLSPEEQHADFQMNVRMLVVLCIASQACICDAC